MNIFNILNLIKFKKILILTFITEYVFFHSSLKLKANRFFKQKSVHR